MKRMLVVLFCVALCTANFGVYAQNNTNPQAPVAPQKTAKQLKDEWKEEEEKLKKSIKYLEKDTIPAKDEQITALKGEIETLEGIYFEKSKELTSLDSANTKDAIFRDKWLRLQTSSLNDKWNNVSIIEVDTAALKADLDELIKSNSADPKILNLKNKLEVLSKDVTLYKAALSAVNSKYDKASIAELLPQTTALRTKLKGDSVAYKIVGDIAWQLESYAVAIEIFQNVIKAIDAVTHDGNSKRVYTAYISVKIDELEESGDIPALKEIPWLGEQWNIYIKNLETDCFKEKKREKGSIAKEIMEIKP